VTRVELRVRQRRGTLALAARETRRVLSLWTQTILPPVLTGVLFLVVFGGALGERIHDVEGLAYVSFILPGVLVMTVAGQPFANCSTSLFQAKNEGYIEDVLSSPLRAGQIALSYVAAGLVRGLSAALVIAALALPFTEHGADPLLAALILVCTALLFSTLGVITGMWAETFDQHAFIANVMITPLTLVGGVFYSARSLTQPWATLTRFNPLYYIVDATRGGLTGVHESPTWLSLPVVAATAAVAFVIASSLIARGWRLKP
jgi:ABC-2 type transport system permease protein